MNYKRKLSVFLAFAMIFSSFVQINAQSQTQIKNIIYMIPDGGGMAPFYLANAVKENGGMNTDVYPYATKSTINGMYLNDYLIGAITTNSADGVTDSAAGGTALSSGYKTTNGFIGLDTDKKPHANILEACQYLGKKAGIISTYEWTHATPAAFSAHDESRSNYTPMSEQIVNQGIDVVLGGGFGSAHWGSIDDAKIRGYNIINTKEDLENVKKGDKIWGNLVSGAFSFDIEREENIPNLAQMTKAAITALSDSDKDGFFLMVEGSKVDSGGHSNDEISMISEFIAFDEACKVAIEYAMKRNDTIVVVCPDHDTGGLVLPENLSAAANAIKNGTDPELSWETTGHTSRNGGLFMYLPRNVSYPKGISGKTGKTSFEQNIIDNTEISPYLASLIGADLDKITQKLFVDVTDMGEFNNTSELFRFYDYPIVAKRNSSYIYAGDKTLSLDGQVCLYVNGHFYVPQLLLDIAEQKSDAVDYSSVIEPMTAYSYVNVYMPDQSDISTWKGDLTITNLLGDKDLKGKIEFTSPESFAAMEPITIDTIPAGETKIISFDCPEFDIRNSNFSFDYNIITDDGISSYSSPFAGFAYSGYTDKGIVVDGIIGEDEWKNSFQMRCDSTSQIVMIEDWKGEHDLSAVFSMMWDEEYFYLYTIVSDEVFCPDTDVANLWQGDSVQFGLYNDTENLMISKNAGKKFEEIGLAYINNIPTAYRFITQKSAPTGEINLREDSQMACVRDGEKLTYELKIKWNEIFGYNYTPKAGDSLGFSALINDNDGEGRRGWIEYGSGIGRSKDVNQFIRMVMLDFSEPANDEIKVVYNGEKINFDVKPIIIEGRTMVPVRAIFEALGATVAWDQETKTVFSTLGDSTVLIQIDNTSMFVNEVEKIIDVPAMIIDGRTLVPVRAISEAYECEVDWNQGTRTVTITK